MLSFEVLITFLFSLISAQAFVQNAQVQSLSSSHTILYAQDQNPDSFMVREIVDYEQLGSVIQLASKPLPERPDGICSVIRYTSIDREDCIATEDEYERLARSNPATIFMRCYAEYEGAEIFMARANIQSWPTFDFFYGGNRVARLEGPTFSELEEVLNSYQLMNSKLDLFSEDADNERRLAWGEGKLAAEATPRTTGRFLPGYDLDSDKGFFDDQGDKFQDDFESSYGEWTPNIED